MKILSVPIRTLSKYSGYKQQVLRVEENLIFARLVPAKILGKLRKLVPEIQRCVIVFVFQENCTPFRQEVRVILL